MPETPGNANWRLDMAEKRIEKVEEACAEVRVLEERVSTLAKEVRAMKSALWGVVGSIVVGLVVFLLQSSP